MIKCSDDALKESHRIKELIKVKSQKEEEFKSEHWQISYLNVRSMKSKNGQREDVRSDNILMDSDMFALGVTSLEKDNRVDYEDYSGFFANFGTGKGVAAFTKTDLIQPPETVSSVTYSAINLKTNHFEII